MEARERYTQWLEGAQLADGWEYDGTGTWRCAYRGKTFRVWADDDGMHVVDTGTHERRTFTQISPLYRWLFHGQEPES